MFSGSTNFVILAVLTLVLNATWHFRQVSLITSPVISVSSVYYYLISLSPLTTGSLDFASCGMGSSLGNFSSNEVLYQDHFIP